MILFSIIHRLDPEKNCTLQVATIAKITDARRASAVRCLVINPNSTAFSSGDPFFSGEHGRLIGDDSSPCIFHFLFNNAFGQQHHLTTLFRTLYTTTEPTDTDAHVTYTHPSIVLEQP